MQNLLTWSFWFNLRPTPLLPAFKYILAALIAIFIILAIVAIIKKRQKGLYHGIWRRIYDFSLTNAILGLLLFFFDYERAPFFSARFWFAFWFVGLAIWIFYIAKANKGLAARKQRQEEEARFKKYLP